MNDPHVSEMSYNHVQYKGLLGVLGFKLGRRTYLREQSRMSA